MKDTAIAASRFAGEVCYTKCLRTCWGSCYAQRSPDSAAAEAQYRSSMQQKHSVMVQELQKQKVNLEREMMTAGKANEDTDIYMQAIKEANRQIEEVSENMGRASL